MWTTTPEKLLGTQSSQLLGPTWKSTNLQVLNLSALYWAPLYVLNHVVIPIYNSPFQPFRIGGVKVYDKNIDRNEIVMDLDIL